MGTLHTFGASFGAAGLSPDAEKRAKAEAEAASVPARIADLPERVRAWSGALDVDALEALAVVAEDFDGNGAAPVRVSFGDLADRLHITTDDAEARVSRCILAGALDVTHRLQASAVYRPVPRHAPGDFATVTSAKGEAQRIAVAAPRASIGLRHRRD